MENNWFYNLFDMFFIYTLTTLVFLIYINFGPGPVRSILLSLMTAGFNPNDLNIKLANVLIKNK